MPVLVINGGKRLSGEAEMHGAKNSALPVLAAAIAAQGVCEIHNCPQLTDIDAAGAILRYLGCAAERDGDVFTVDSSCLTRCDIPERLMRRMRSSVAFLGAMLTRCEEVRFSAPGGCELGPRPIDLHLDSFRKMGVSVIEQGGCVILKRRGRLRAAGIQLSFPSVGATENIMTAAVTADGTTTVTNAACEPEIVDLANFLRSCGARIKGDGTTEITVEGVERLHGCVHSVIPDRIEAATYMAAAAVTGGCVTLRKVCPRHLLPVLPAFERMHCRVESSGDIIRVTAPARLRAAGYIRTMPYPGFPTDAQAIVMACACTADGSTVINETIFDSRFRHACELRRMGARIKTDGRIAVVEGVGRLCGANVFATDLRGAAAMVVAGLSAEGVTTVSQLHHLDRGYQDTERTLSALGADIKRTDG